VGPGRGRGNRDQHPRRTVKARMRQSSRRRWAVGSPSCRSARAHESRPGLCCGGSTTPCSGRQVLLAQQSVKAAEAQASEACLAAKLAEKELLRGRALVSTGHQRGKPSTPWRVRGSWGGNLSGGNAAPTRRALRSVSPRPSLLSPCTRAVCRCRRRLQHGGRGVDHTGAARVAIPAVLDLHRPGSM